ncbi:MAG: hypothetical protein GAK29_00402 [Acinetobacter bereziniae]|uniref:Uncharacterized protein n=1 Tax=Acinetobacter bereziniae TaxID=106648 RepID=A0A833PIL5_ACIBZ|nr:MAG: hypothetical protein GAK29_00402 [Acinetobacter bereziniae]
MHELGLSKRYNSFFNHSKAQIRRFAEWGFQQGDYIVAFKESIHNY